MKNIYLSLIPMIFLPSFTWADIKFYGKGNVSLQSADENGNSVSEVVSNASRVGLKGSEALRDDFTAIYQAEFEVQFDDGEKGDNEETFSQRNIYIGLKTIGGTIIAGKFDTPLKKAQKKIDLFNDLEGDIKNIITPHDNRTSNTVMYSTPSSLGPFKVSAALVASEDEDRNNGASLALAFDDNGFYVAGAYDQDVEGDGIDVLRLVTQYNWSNWQFGALWEEADTDSESTDGWLLSAAFKIKDFTLKGQVGESDIVEQGGENLSLGADYKLTDKVKLFSYYTIKESNEGTDADYLGIGAEVKF